jgi:hypothetical protein
MALRNRRRERRRLCQKAAAEARRKAAHEALTLSALLKDWQALHLSSERPRYAAEAVRALRAAAARRRSSGSNLPHSISPTVIGTKKNARCLIRNDPVGSNHETLTTPRDNMKGFLADEPVLGEPVSGQIPSYQGKKQGISQNR